MAYINNAHLHLAMELPSASPWVVITGGGSGIGRGLVHHFCQQGPVLTCGRRLESLRQTKDTAPEPKAVSIVACDIATAEGREQLLKALPSQAPVRLLVQNAAIGDPAAFEQLDLKHFELAHPLIGSLCHFVRRRRYGHHAATAAFDPRASVLLLSIFLAPDPALLLGSDLGRLVVIARSIGKIFTFMFAIPVTSVHPQFDCLEHVMKNVKQSTNSDRLSRVIDLVDDYGWNRGFLINVGDVKGEVVEDTLQARVQSGAPVKLVLELGTFVGYGTLRLARQLNATKGVELITVDPDVMAYTISSSLYEQAGVREQISMKTDYSYNVFQELKDQQKKIDFLFIDHVKQLYLSDLKLALQMDLLAPGCVVVADNILAPGAPDYKEYMLTGEGSKIFQTEVHRLHVEYWRSFPDEVTVSKYLG
eukprot:s192_g39.t1